MVLIFPDFGIVIVCHELAFPLVFIVGNGRECKDHTLFNMPANVSYISVQIRSTLGGKIRTVYILTERILAPYISVLDRSTNICQYFFGRKCKGRLDSNMNAKRSLFLRL